MRRGAGEADDSDAERCHCGLKMGLAVSLPMLDFLERMTFNGERWFKIWMTAVLLFSWT